MSEFHIEPANDMVLVIDIPQENTIDGIELPDNIRQKEMVTGVVASLGPVMSEYTHVGDTVCYGPYAGKHVVSNGKEFRLLREGQIELYLRKTN